MARSCLSSYRVSLKVLKKGRGTNSICAAQVSSGRGVGDPMQDRGIVTVLYGTEVLGATADGNTRPGTLAGANVPGLNALSPERVL